MSLRKLKAVIAPEKTQETLYAPDVSTSFGRRGSAPNAEGAYSATPDSINGAGINSSQNLTPLELGLWPPKHILWIRQCPQYATGHRMYLSTTDLAMERREHEL